MPGQNCIFIIYTMNNTIHPIIAHFDLDSFFVSVECINDPSLKGKPVIVGGHNERGVVAACSYEARKFGIHSAMSMKTAMRLCPNAIVVSGTRGEYGKYSRIVTDIIAAKAPLFEKASIDEFYLDLTGMDKFFEPLEWTIRLRQEIIDKTTLPISFGIGRNKMVAKMATNEAKPNGYLYVPFGHEKNFLAPLDVGKIPGVGEQSNSLLKYKGIKKIADIQNSTERQMEGILGKWGIDLYNRSFGIHQSRIEPYSEAKSISTENTFDENIIDMDFLMKEIVRMTEKIAFELRNDGKLTACLTIKLRYPDFETNTKQSTIPNTCADDELIPIAKALFHKLYKKGRPVRLLGVKLSSLTNDTIQTNIFRDVERKTDLYKAIDDVKNRFGKYSVNRASSK